MMGWRDVRVESFSSSDLPSRAREAIASEQKISPALGTSTRLGRIARISYHFQEKCVVWCVLAAYFHYSLKR
jgi:hypothetical protein